MDLAKWLLTEFDDSVGRLRNQVLALIPPPRRSERPGGGNSILWGEFHSARHAALALSVLGYPDSPPGGDAFSRVGSQIPAGGGLQEAQQPWIEGLAADEVDDYFASVERAVQRYLLQLSSEQLDELPDVELVLDKAGISRHEFGWLYDMWGGESAAFFVRWPLTGHLCNHVGEMIATRNRMGLSPF